MSRMTTKGQITIPKRIRERMGVEPGDEIRVEERDGKIVLAKVARPSRLDKWVGYLKGANGTTSDEVVAEMRDRWQ